MKTSQYSSTPSRGVSAFKGSRRIRAAVTECSRQCATPSPRSPLPVQVVEDLEWLVDGGAELQL
eukprot:1056376-Amphidinium_carterae.1